MIIGRNEFVQSGHFTSPICLLICVWRVGTDVHPKFNPEYGVQLAIYIIMLGFRSTEERSALTQNLDFTCIYRK